MVDSVFTTVTADDAKAAFKLYVKFSDTNLSLTVIQKSNAWTKTVDYNDLKTQAVQFETGTEEYYIKLKEYFLVQPANVKFSLNKSKFVLHCIPDNNIKIVYFSCVLDKVSYEGCVVELLDGFYREKQEIASNLTKITKEKEDLLKLKTELETELQEFIKRKQADDHELYSSFSLVLNEKKRKILHLSELLQAFRNGRSLKNPSPPPVKRKITSKSVPEVKLEQISESDSDVLESDESLKPIEELDEVDEPGPSTSKRIIDYLLGDSPPAQQLPRKIRREEPDNNEEVNAKITVNDSKKIISEPVEESSPVVECMNTQELFDML